MILFSFYGNSDAFLSCNIKRISNAGCGSDCAIHVLNLILNGLVDVNRDKRKKRKASFKKNNPLYTCTVLAFNLLSIRSMLGHWGGGGGGANSHTYFW